eukprot:c6801_g1_i1.p1 GENE.c6801_g1_i1~~c6801_g1_i1.p1  ORF type:complete len:242 (+),score=52.92 c6801_g1_i1:48-728(+)
MSEPNPKRAKTVKDDAKVEQSLGSLNAIQDDLQNIHSNAIAEIEEVDKKFLALKRPFFEKRREHIAKIPNFWGTAISNHPLIGRIVSSEADQDILKFLEDVDVQHAEGEAPFIALIFQFASNPHFENHRIEKKVIFEDGLPSFDSTPVQWKKGKEPKPSAEDAEEIELTFAEWLNGGAEQETALFAEFFKDELWPNPLKFYNRTFSDDGDEDGEDSEGLAEVDEDQ